jgi:hypothetical protein
MKNIFKNLFLLTITLVTTSSCVNDDDFEIPTIRIPFFAEDFEGIDDANVGFGQSITLTDWSNVSLNGGSRLWEARTYGGEKYALLSAFGSGEASMDTWLITPSFNFDITNNETMAFEYLSGYNNGQAVSVLISSDYDGSGTVSAVNTATWTDLEVSLPDFATSGYPSTFSKSGAIDISSFNGENVYIAFRYLGGSSGITSTYEIDNIKLYEK